MLGEGWYMNANVGGVAINPPGCVGLPLHASGFADPTYYSSESRPHSCKLNLGWQLHAIPITASSPLLGLAAPRSSQP